MSIQLKVNEIYKSIQGESSFQGLPFAFVRLTGCSLRCAWCDSAHAFYAGVDRSIEEIVNTVTEFGVRHVLVTGGEPLDQEACPALCRSLLEAGYTVILETAGSHSLLPLPEDVHCIVDIKLPSSKMQQRIHKNIYDELMPHHEVKFVIADRLDYDTAREILDVHNLPERCPVLFSPVFDNMPYENLVNWILEDNLQVRFQLQIHKVIWHPATKGV